MLEARPAKFRTERRWERWTHGSGNVGLPIYVNKIAFRGGKFILTGSGRTLSSPDTLAWD